LIRHGLARALSPAKLIIFLFRVVGRCKMSRFIEDLARLHVTSDEIGEGYRAMAADHEREREALEWSEALIGDGVRASW
jgi:hypothetical protein